MNLRAYFFTLFLVISYAFQNLEAGKGPHTKVLGYPGMGNDLEREIKIRGKWVCLAAFMLEQYPGFIDPQDPGAATEKRKAVLAKALLRTVSPTKSPSAPTSPTKKK